MVLLILKQPVKSMDDDDDSPKLSKILRIYQIFGAE